MVRQRTESESIGRSSTVALRTCEDSTRIHGCIMSSTIARQSQLLWEESKVLAVTSCVSSDAPPLAPLALALALLLLLLLLPSQLQPGAWTPLPAPPMLVASTEAAAGWHGGSIDLSTANLVDGTVTHGGGGVRAFASFSYAATFCSRTELAYRRRASSSAESAEPTPPAGRTDGRLPAYQRASSRPSSSAVAMMQESALGAMSHGRSRRRVHPPLSDFYSTRHVPIICPSFVPWCPSPPGSRHAGRGRGPDLSSVVLAHKVGGRRNASCEEHCLCRSLRAAHAGRSRTQVAALAIAVATRSLTEAVATIEFHRVVAARHLEVLGEAVAAFGVVEAQVVARGLAAERGGLAKEHTSACL